MLASKSARKGGGMPTHQLLVLTALGLAWLALFVAR